MDGDEFAARLHSLAASSFSPGSRGPQRTGGIFPEECNAASAKLSLPQRWGLQVDRWYTPEGSSSRPPPLNKELWHLMQNRDLSVTIPWHLATQIEGILSGLVDITSWIDQDLGAFAGLSPDA